VEQRRRKRNSQGLKPGNPQCNRERSKRERKRRRMRLKQRKLLSNTKRRKRMTRRLM
jgi:hypothetical protein